MDNTPLRDLEDIHLVDRAMAPVLEAPTDRLLLAMGHLKHRSLASGVEWQLEGFFRGYSGRGTALDMVQVTADTDMEDMGEWEEWEE